MESGIIIRERSVFRSSSIVTDVVFPPTLQAIKKSAADNATNRMLMILFDIVVRYFRGQKYKIFSRRTRRFALKKVCDVL